MNDLRVDLSAEMRRQYGVPDGDEGEQQPTASTTDERISPAEKQRLVAAERARCVEVLRACELAGQPERGGEMVASGLSIGDVVQRLGATRGAGRRGGRA